MTEKVPLEKTAEEKLGESLRRARQAANIEVSELAREIRIPTEMLEHLENGNYDKLPVQAYVRGYLNTICTRLDLNRAKVLDWYAGEVGRDYEAVIATDSLSGQINSGSKSSTTRSSLSSSPNSDKGPNKIVFVVVAVALVLFLVIMNLRGKKEDAEANLMQHTTDSLDSVHHADSALRSESLSVSDTAGLTADSISDSVKMKDSAAVKDSVKDTTATVKPVAAAGKSETTIKFECIKDSTWVRVKKVGGLAWARVVHRTDKPRYLSHNDTMKISIGFPDKTRFYINDELIKIPDNYFKVYNGKIIEKKK